MKLSKLKATKEEVGFQLNYNGEPLYNEDGVEVKLFMLGKASDAYQKLQDKYLNKALERTKSRKPMQDELTLEKIKRDEIEAIVACSVRLEGMTDDNDATITTKEQFVEIYSDPANKWLRDQAVAFLEEDSNFTKSASTK